MTIPQTFTGRPISRHAEKFISMGSGPFKSSQNFVAFGNLLLNSEIQIRKCRSHPAQNILQSFDARPLSGNGTCSTTSSQT